MIYLCLAAFVCGTLCLNLCRTIPHVYWVLFLSLLGYLYWRCKFIFVIALFLLGFCWACFYAGMVSSWSLPDSLQGKVVAVTGVVATIPQAKEHHLHFVFAMRSPAKAKLSLSWYNKYPQVRAGDKWQLWVKLKRPHGTMNPGGFDYEKYLFLHHLRAVGYVVKGKLIKDGHSWRQQIAAKVTNNIIAALTIGLKSGITTKEWQVLRNTGTAHLMAISGLHIGLIFGFIYLLFNIILCRIYYLSLRFPMRHISAIMALFAAFVYGAVAGFPLPTIRALIMLTVFVAAMLWRRNISVWYGWLVALAIVVLLNPLASLSAGFWLSFGAVAILIYSFSGRVHLQRWWWNWSRAQFVIIVGLMPLSLLFFQQISLVSFLANMIAIPWVGFVVVPLSLIGEILLFIYNKLGLLFIALAEKCLKLLWLYLQWLASWHYSVWHHAIANNWVLLAAVIGVCLILTPKKFPAKWLGIIWLLPLFFYQSPRPKEGEVWLTLLDVGQGLAAVVQTRHHVLVYDTGPKYSANFDAGSAVVVPFLRSQNIVNINMLVVSHGDNDHIGGAKSLLAAFKVKKILTSVPKRFLHATHCYNGQKWTWDGVAFTILAPEKNSALMGNNASCVLHVRGRNNTILLPGDIELPAENKLLKYKILSSILIAPHHGSGTSSSSPFIKAVDPKFVIFPVGYLNRYHFPNSKVVARYRAIGAQLFDTDKSGALTFLGHGIVEEYRKITERYYNG